jgi:hypothetical protein
MIQPRYFNKIIKYINVNYLNITKIDNNETFTLQKLSNKVNYIS